MKTLSLKQFDAKIESLEKELESSVAEIDRKKLMIANLKEARDFLYKEEEAGNGSTADYERLTLEYIEKNGDGHYKKISETVNEQMGGAKISEVTINSFLNKCVKNGLHSIVKVQGRRGVFGIKKGDTSSPPVVQSQDVISVPSTASPSTSEAGVVQP
jgi:DNA-directed RNA polymerase subunit F